MKKVAGYCLLILPYALLLFSAFLVFNETADDPFITFRYAANVRAGHGPVFNIGEHVEGFSSPLHLLLSVLLLTVFPFVGILFKAKLLSLTCGLITIALTAKLVRKIGGKTEIAIVAQSLIALNVNFAIAAVNGLETTLYAALLLLCIIQFVTEYQSKRGILSGLLLWLAWLARPEAILVFSLLFVARLAFVRWKLLTFASLVGWLLLFLLPVTCIVLLRLSYYGLVFPNTYYAKDAPIGMSIKVGAHCLLQGLSPHLLELTRLSHGTATPSAMLYIGAAVLFWGLAAIGCAKFPEHNVRLIVGAAVTATSLFILRSGGDWMMGWRFMTAAVPYLAIMQSYGMLSLVDILQKWFDQQVKQRTEDSEKVVGVSAFYIGLVAFSLVFAVWLTALFVSPLNPWSNNNFGIQDRQFIARNSSGLGPLWIKVTEYVDANVKRNTSIAYTEMGFCTFYNLDKTFIDLRGLTNHEVAMVSAHLKSKVGVSDLNWWRSDSEVGSIIQTCQPQIIIDAVRPGCLPHNVDNYRIAEKIPVDPVAQESSFTLIIYNHVDRTM